MNPYIKRRMGKEPVTFDHPSLEPALGETLGVILYQEQVLQVAMALAGFTRGAGGEPAPGDEPQALGGGDREAEGAVHRGVPGAGGVAARWRRSAFQKIAGFAAFGFPKAHAAAFGLLAYQTAWLRTYYPSESLCALFNAQPMGFYAPHVLVNDGKRHGVAVLPPDINLQRGELQDRGGNWKSAIGNRGGGCTVRAGNLRDSH